MADKKKKGVNAFTLFSPGSKGARDPDYVREYLTDDDARDLLSRLMTPSGGTIAGLSTPDAYIVKKLNEKAKTGGRFTGAELVVLLHIQGVVAAFAASKL